MFQMGLSHNKPLCALCASVPGKNQSEQATWRSTRISHLLQSLRTGHLAVSFAG